MKRQAFIRIGAVAQAVAGLIWAIKAGAIMVTGVQPPALIELGQLLFPVGIIGIYRTLDRPQALEKTGLVLAIISLAATLAGWLYSLLPGAQVPTGEEFVFPTSLFLLIGSVGGFVAFVLIGIAVLRTGKSWNNWRKAPIIVALLPLPLIATAVVHFEFPIFLIGVAWLVLAYGLWRVANSNEFSETNRPVAA